MRETQPHAALIAMVHADEKPKYHISCYLGFWFILSLQDFCFVIDLASVKGTCLPRQ